jgi:hypothetical protein
MRGEGADVAETRSWSNSLFVKGFGDGEFAVNVLFCTQPAGMQDTTLADPGTTGGTGDRG